MRLSADLVTHNWSLKLAALVLSFLFWTTIQADVPRQIPVNGVPIEVRLRDADWMLAAPPAPSTFTVTLRGPSGELLSQLAAQRPRLVVTVEEVTDSIELRVVREEWVEFPGPGGSEGVIDVVEVRPSTLRLSFERLSTELVPVAVRTRGTLPFGVARTGPIRTDPPAVRVSGPTRRLQALDSVPLRPIALGGLRDTVRAEVALDTSGLGGLIISPQSVDVLVPVADTLRVEGATLAELLFEIPGR